MKKSVILFLLLTFCLNVFGIGIQKDSTSRIYYYAFVNKENTNRQLLEKSDNYKQESKEKIKEYTRPKKHFDTLFILPQNYKNYNIFWVDSFLIADEFFKEIKIDQTSYLYMTKPKDYTSKDSLNYYFFTDFCNFKTSAKKFLGIKAQYIQTNNFFKHQPIINIKSKTDIQYNQNIIWPLILCIVLCLIAFYYNKGYLNRISNALIFKQTFDIIAREQNQMAELASKFLFFNYIISLSIFGYICTKEYNYFGDLNFWTIIAYSLAIVFGYFFLKLIISSILSLLFDAREIFKQYYKYNYYLIETLGVGILILNFCLIYNNVFTFHKFFLAILFFGGSVGLFLKFLKLFLINIRKQFSYFYIFLYLCAVEILPILVLIKFLQS